METRASTSIVLVTRLLPLPPNLRTNLASPLLSRNLTN